LRFVERCFVRCFVLFFVPLREHVFHEEGGRGTRNVPALRVRDSLNAPANGASFQAA
jgi:hypothetical protein